MSDDDDRAIEGLTDQLVGVLENAFPAPRNHDEEAKQDCIKLAALLHTITDLALETSCDDCRHEMMKFARRYIKMLARDIQPLRAQVFPSVEVH